MHLAYKRLECDRKVDLVQHYSRKIHLETRRITIRGNNVIIYSIEIINEPSKTPMSAACGK